MTTPLSTQEWLETDGLGGFASGTATGIRTRRYHALLLTATTPPTGRVVLVNGFDAWVETPGGRFSLSSQHYSPDVIGGDGAQHIDSFHFEPFPHWRFALPDGTRIEAEIFAVQGQPTTCLTWRLLSRTKQVTLHLRPFLSGRDYHSLHRSNPAFKFDAEVHTDRVSWKPYETLPGITALTNGTYAHEPHWYRNFCYEEERLRGLNHEEDLGAPGILSWNLSSDEASLVLTTAENAREAIPPNVVATSLVAKLRAQEQARRSGFSSPWHRAADAYLVQRPRTPGSNSPRSQTIIAGYPWFTDWGRDTLIALRGLCLATGRLAEAREILLTWAGTVSEGMLPNRFADQGDQPEFNAVDASLWFVIAAHHFLEFAKHKGLKLGTDRDKLLTAMELILEGYGQGTRFGIQADSDGLLACGASGTQLTWMDAKIGNWVVTPRVGKPVEVQALWLNALWIAGQHQHQHRNRWLEKFHHGLASFQNRFWNPQRNQLYDVVDVDHQHGKVDSSFRPNQIFAVGGLPLRLVDESRASLIVESVTQHLWTAMGLRSLAPGEPGYRSQYRGGVLDRDAAYHQGTVWPWLMGAFVDAWVGVRHRTPSALREARRVFLQPLIEHLQEAGLGHISEIADADPPHAPRGCPWQAWSLGEMLWLDQVVLAGSSDSASGLRDRTTRPSRVEHSSPFRRRRVVRPRSRSVSAIRLRD